LFCFLLIRRMEIAFWNQHTSLQMLSNFLLSHTYQACLSHIKEIVGNAVRELISALAPLKGETDMHKFEDMIEVYLKRTHNDATGEGERFIEEYLTDFVQTTLPGMCKIHPVNVRVLKMAIYFMKRRFEAQKLPLIGHLRAYCLRKLRELCEVSLKQHVKLQADNRLRSGQVAQQGQQEQEQQQQQQQQRKPAEGTNEPAERTNETAVGPEESSSTICASSQVGNEAHHPDIAESVSYTAAYTKLQNALKPLLVLFHVVPLANNASFAAENEENLSPVTDDLPALFMKETCAFSLQPDIFLLPIIPATASAGLTAAISCVSPGGKGGDDDIKAAVAADSEVQNIVLRNAIAHLLAETTNVLSCLCAATASHPLYRDKGILTPFSVVPVAAPSSSTLGTVPSRGVQCLDAPAHRDSGLYFAAVNFVRLHEAAVRGVVVVLQERGLTASLLQMMSTENPFPNAAASAAVSASSSTPTSSTGVAGGGRSRGGVKSGDTISTSSSSSSNAGNLSGTGTGGGGGGGVTLSTMTAATVTATSSSIDVGGVSLLPTPEVSVESLELLGKIGVDYIKYLITTLPYLLYLDVIYSVAIAGGSNKESDAEKAPQNRDTVVTYSAVKCYATLSLQLRHSGEDAADKIDLFPLPTDIVYVLLQSKLLSFDTVSRALLLVLRPKTAAYYENCKGLLGMRAGVNQAMLSLVGRLLFRYQQELGLDMSSVLEDEEWYSDSSLRLLIKTNLNESFSNVISSLLAGQSMSKEVN
jgi:hypothetical protein